MKRKRSYMSKVVVHDINGKNFNVDSKSLVFNPAVYGIIIKRNKILLLPVSDKYALPGGSIEIGEDHIEALKREIKEETGLTIKPVKILNIYTSLYKSFKTGTNYHCIQLFYICKTTTATQAKVHFTADEKKYLKPAHWVEISKLKSLNYIGSEPIFKDIIKNFI